MSGAMRIAGKGRLVPARRVGFTFDGQAMQALCGDTLASALLANGVHLTGRSFKYHRPRGILSAGPEEPNALLDVSRGGNTHTPNVRAPVQEVFDGLVARSQNRWPSLTFDLGAINNFLSPLFPAGFYYKTFMWPKAAWTRFYEPVIRAAAGLGVAPKEPDPDRYANRYIHCDVLVIGAGLAGLLAAQAAAEAGADVILCDEQPAVGGALWHEIDTRIDGEEGFEWAQATAQALSGRDNVRVLTRTTAFSYQAQNMVALVERVSEHVAAPARDQPRERLWQVRAKQVIVATGAIERPMVFSGNDRPGVLLASAARTYLNHFGVAVGANVGVYTANDSAYAAAFDLADAGINILAIIDFRDEVNEGLRELAAQRGIDVLCGHCVTGTAGSLRISGMRARPRSGGPERKWKIDALITSSGWTPSVHLYSQSRGKVVWDAATQRFLPGPPVQDMVTIGACNGTDEAAALADEAMAAGKAAARLARAAHDGASSDTPSQSRPDLTVQTSRAGALLGAGSREVLKGGKAFVDFQNDVTAKDIELAVREGMRSIEHIKRFTTTGMATDQGKTSNLHGLAIAAEMLDRPIPEVGLTTFRHPYTPVSFGALVNHGRGPLFDPTRRTAMHLAHEQQGAEFEDVGQWKRPWYYPQAGEDMAAAVNRECRTVREVAGLFDASTLGKIEVVGPDAAKFLDLVYTNGWDKLSPGRCKYGIMLREDGFIFDDGVVGRIANDRFHVTTTTGGAPRVLHHMEDYLQTEYPDLRVWLTSTTDQWAVIAVQGPKARDIIAPFVEGIDISAEAMPHMSVREGQVCGVAARLFRVSFTGETGFEVNVPADYGKSVWDMLWTRARALGACCYGTETMHVLRAEKGYIIVGQDTDGTVTPGDAGLGWAVAKKKTDFVGIRGLKRPDLVADGRKQLVGLHSRDGRTVLEEGAQIVADPHQSVPMTMIGHVTSAYWSENCGGPIALALVENGRQRIGETLYVPMAEEVLAVEVTETVFFDRAGERING
ncbi:sarcosine oxidase subunit alpha family protein [Pseudohoeflea coraliihabitans]|uniref:Sarcosine oxidase subunit alpha family protein n=1 Tax=Pseudohoeflea coraliihabitans TaxID=2860393 RepID=A0ABS6WK85_9HYPH|nr:sarcosine oxidase subunit alpha family protein [Pseudohoeflea sp. DP4N28-3]MBW3096356.1 sarcosine oxidase subunit alpha family protein [Pseudohoeflea sp. DP4N28-3]